MSPESEMEATSMDQATIIIYAVTWILFLVASFLVGWLGAAVIDYFIGLHRNSAEVLALVKQSEERSAERHRETQAALRELSYRVGTLEGSGGVRDDAAPRSGRHPPATG